MATQHWFRQFRDQHLVQWEVHGNAAVTGYVIDSRHTSDGRSDVNVIDAYNSERYMRSDAELELMGQIHKAYLSGDARELARLTDEAERVFAGSRGVVELYRIAASKL